MTLRTRQGNLCLGFEFRRQHKIGLGMLDIMLHKFLNWFTISFTFRNITFPRKPMIMLHMIGKIVVIAKAFIAMFTLKRFFKCSDFACSRRIRFFGVNSRFGIFGVFLIVRQYFFFRIIYMNALDMISKHIHMVKGGTAITAAKFLVCTGNLAPEKNDDNVSTRIRPGNEL